MLLYKSRNCFILFLECSLEGIKYVQCKIENENDFYLWVHLALQPVTPILFVNFSSYIYLLIHIQ